MVFLSTQRNHNSTTRKIMIQKTRRVIEFTSKMGRNISAEYFLSRSKRLMKTSY